MNFRSKSRRDEPEVNLVPLVDVALLLVVFFMLSTTFVKMSAITLDLPEAAPQAQSEPKRPLEITIDASGQFYVNEQRVINTQVETLKQALQKAAGNDTKIPLLISADAKTPHQAVVTAMDAAGQLGFVHLSLATKQATGRQKP
ncbi:MAG: biopolymer transporter ExbD [Gammaproteobacteria bacterium]|nr:biopolymer transporter ExbD [Gammaproteobacteria bacterium]